MGGKTETETEIIKREKKKQKNKAKVRARCQARKREIVAETAKSSSIRESGRQFLSQSGRDPTALHLRHYMFQSQLPPSSSYRGHFTTDVILLKEKGVGLWQRVLRPNLFF